MENIDIGSRLIVRGELLWVANISHTKTGTRLVMSTEPPKKKRGNTKRSEISGEPPKRLEYYMWNGSTLDDVRIRQIVYTGTNSVTFMDLRRSLSHEDYSFEKNCSYDAWMEWEKDAKKISKSFFKKIFGHNGCDDHQDF